MKVRYKYLVKGVSQDVSGKWYAFVSLTNNLKETKQGETYETKICKEDTVMYDAEEVYMSFQSVDFKSKAYKERDTSAMFSQYSLSVTLMIRNRLPLWATNNFAM